MICENNLIKFAYDNNKYIVPLDKPWNAHLENEESDDYVDDTFIDKIDRSNEPINYFTLHLTEKCNLNCSYCFEKNKNNTNITLDVLDKFIDFVKKRNLKTISIRLFGGEPLLDLTLLENVLLKLEKDLINNGTNIMYNIFTNGTCINEKAINLIDKYSIQVFVSIDGCKYIHDMARKDINGHGTYDLIIKNIKKLQEKKSRNITVRTILNPNIDNYSLIDIVETFYKENLPLCSMEFPWVTKEDDFSLNEYKIENMINCIHDYGKEYIKRVSNNDYSIIGLSPLSVSVKN